MTTFLSQAAPLLNQLLALVLLSLLASLTATYKARVKNHLAVDALASLTATAATLVMGAADEARTIKQDTPYNADARAEALTAIKNRVLGDLRVMGADALAQLRAAKSLDEDAVSRLLNSITEASVEDLRRDAGNLASE